MGGGTLYCTVPYCKKLYSTPSKFSLKKTFFAFLDELGHIDQFLGVFGQLKKNPKFLAISKLKGGGSEKFGKIPNFSVAIAT